MGRSVTERCPLGKLAMLGRHEPPGLRGAPRVSKQVHRQITVGLDVDRFAPLEITLAVPIGKGLGVDAIRAAPRVRSSFLVQLESAKRN